MHCRLKAPSGVGWQRSALRPLRVLVYFVYPKAPSGVGMQRFTLRPLRVMVYRGPISGTGYACGGPIRSGFRV